MKGAALAAFLLAQGHTLRTGDWNARIHATQNLADAGTDALPLLAEAAHDADWQVRMTAVHQMGRLGRPGLPALETVLQEEPCRTVRLTALHWMGNMGPEASDALRRALADESGMVRLMGKYWLRKDGEGDGGEQWEAEAAAKESLKACASSPHAGKAAWALKKAAPPSDPDAPVEEIHEVVITRDPVVSPATAPARAGESFPPAPAGFGERDKPDAGGVAYSPTERRRIKELDEILGASGKEPEKLPPAPAGFGERDKPATSGAAYAAADRRELKTGEGPLGARDRAAEKLPSAPSGFGEREKPATAGAEYAADDGKTKVSADPLPVLIELLKTGDPARRSRAADDIGKRGADAAPAIPALTAALKDRSPRVRASAALALGNLGAAADPAVPALVAALKKGPEEVSWSAAIALGRVGTPRARKAFSRATAASPAR